MSARIRLGSPRALVAAATVPAQVAAALVTPALVTPALVTPALVTAALITAALATAACSGPSYDPDDPRDVLQRVQDEDYRAWDRAPGYETRQPAESPHSRQVDIFINSTVKKVLDRGKSIDEWPEGSIIVKDGWSGPDLRLIALMEKRSDGWYWAEYDALGDTEYYGKPDVCINCHDSGSDMVRAFSLP